MESSLTHPKAIDEAADDHLREMEGKYLQDRANQIGGQSDEVAASASQCVTNTERKETADRCAKLFLGQVDSTERRWSVRENPQRSSLRRYR